MLEKFSKVDNPLTIIAIFAGITEVASSVALPFLDHEIQHVFVWFLIFFPFALIIAFFLTLNFNTKALYAPADYRDDKHFLQALSLSENTLQVNVKSTGDAAPIIRVPQPSSLSIGRMPPFDGINRKELDAVNAAVEIFGGKTKGLFKTNVVDSYSFGIHGEGIFLLTVHLKNIDEPGPDSISRIIRPKISGDKVELRIVGRRLTSSDPEEFAELLLRSIEEEIVQLKDSEALRKKAASPATEPMPAAVPSSATPEPRRS
jgi:hypothetical protein